MNPGMEIPQVVLEIQPVVRPRDAVHPRRGLRPKREVRRPQAIDIDVMQERGEPRFLVRLRHSTHTTKLTERALSGTESGARFAGRVPLGWSPSLHRLRRPALGVVRQLHRYYATIRLLTIVHHGITAVAFPARPAPPSRQAGDREISRFSCMKRSRACTGSSTPRGPLTAREKRRQRCCLPLNHSTSAPRCCLFRGCIAGLRAPRIQRFAAPSRVANAWTGPSRFARSSM